jgi:hypothetical protein
MQKPILPFPLCQELLDSSSIKLEHVLPHVEETQTITSQIHFFENMADDWNSIGYSAWFFFLL